MSTRKTRKPDLGGGPSLAALEALYFSGRYRDLISACKRQIATSRSVGKDAAHLMAAGLQAQNDFAGALRVYDDYFKPADLLPKHLNNQGAALAALGKTKEAIAAIQRALELDTRFTAGHLNLACLQMKAGKPREAVKHLQTYLALAPAITVPSPAARDSEAFDDGSGEVPSASRLAKGIEAHLLLIDLLESQNRLSEAEEVLKVALGAVTDDPRLLLLQARLAVRRGSFGECLRRLESPAFSSGGLSRRLRMDRAFLQGEALDRLSRYDEAFSAFSEANWHYQELFRHFAAAGEAYLHRIRYFKQHFSRLRRRGGTLRDSVQPAGTEIAFIIGFPRSGTTLLDAILRGSNACHVLDEKPFLAEFISSLGTAPEAALPALENLSGSQAAAARNDYLRKSLLSAKGGESILIDKLPLNIADVPFIVTLFPEAKFLLALRHPCDVVLSCFMQQFAPNGATMNMTSLEDATSLYDEVMSLWQFYQQAFSLNTCPVQYESLVTDPEATVRAVTSFLGIAYQESMLDFPRTALSQDRISTPSYSQVVQPIYARSISKWQHYRNHFPSGSLRQLAKWVEAQGFGTGGIPGT